MTSALRRFATWDHLLCTWVMLSCVTASDLTASTSSAGASKAAPTNKAVKKDPHYTGILYYPAEEKSAAEALLYHQLNTAESRSHWELIPLSTKHTDKSTEQEQAAQALLHGVSELPCVIMSYRGQPYARLFKNDIKKSNVVLAEQRGKDAPILAADFSARLASELYQLNHLLQPADGTHQANDLLDAKQLELWIKRCRALAASPDCSEEQEQFIRLRFLYPLLLMEYTQLYHGGHTRASEEKFLEAITELEQARDIIPTSTLGRRAYTLREEMRRARLKAKDYD